MRSLVMLATTSLVAAFVVWLFSFGFHTNSLFTARAGLRPAAAHAMAPRPHGESRSDGDAWALAIPGAEAFPRSPVG